VNEEAQGHWWLSRQKKEKKRKKKKDVTLSLLSMCLLGTENEDTSIL
jgi:hypothetical protein